MSEHIDQWPRVHTCLYNWCPKKSEECDRCDKVVAIMVAASRVRDVLAGRDPDAPHSSGDRRD